jgi:hypothetical protein
MIRSRVVGIFMLNPGVDVLDDPAPAVVHSCLGRFISDATSLTSLSHDCTGPGDDEGVDEEESTGAL